VSLNASDGAAPLHPAALAPSALRQPAIDAVLATAATLLGMEVVFIGGLTDTTFTLERVATSGDLAEHLVEGLQMPRTDSFCHQMLNGAPQASSDIPHEPAYAAVAALLPFALTTYVGVPVTGPDGTVVATLCGVDRSAVPIDDQAVEVLRHLAAVVSTYLQPIADEGLVIRRSPGGGWQVGDADGGDLTSAMVLADLLAEDLGAKARPNRPESPMNELSQLRLSVTQLEHALAARVVVEQAIGVLTERQRHTPREAFERLRKVARARGRKVHDLAREVVLSATDPAVPLPPELAGRL
jgi:hypothetical protein